MWLLILDPYAGHVFVFRGRLQQPGRSSGQGFRHACTVRRRVLCGGESELSASARPDRITGF